MTSTLEAVAALKRPIQQWTRGWMLVPETDQRGVDLGLRDGEQFWIVGRAGVLGDGDAEVAVAGLAYIAPARVRAAWDELPAGLTPRKIADDYAARIFEWGDRELPRFGEERLGRLDELARRVEDAAPASVGAVFAGWRAVPAPAGTGARVALTMHVMRELRGAASIVALHAVGLTPLQAVLASPAPAPRSGPPWAKHLGWEGPFESVEPLRARRERAEDLTNEILVPYFDVLDADELAELVDLATSIRDAIDM